MAETGTYEIKDVVIKHPTAGDLQKKEIYYYREDGTQLTKEGFLDEKQTPIRPGYTLKEK